MCFVHARFSSVQELVDFATGVIYRAAVQHSVTCGSMLDMYAFAPNAPTAMMRPPPRAKRGTAGWDEEVSDVVTCTRQTCV